MAPKLSLKRNKEQECIPVGCVPPAAVAVMGGVSTHPSRAGTPPSQIPLNFPLGVGLDQIPLSFPLGCGPGLDPPQLPPWVWAWKPARHAGTPPTETCCKACWDTTCNACWDSTPPPVNRITDACENINLAPTSLRTVITFLISLFVQNTRHYYKKASH